MVPVCSSNSVPLNAEETQGLVYAALTARIKFLEAKNKSLTQQLALLKSIFRLSDIEYDNALIWFYTRFSAYEILMYL